MKKSVELTQDQLEMALDILKASRQLAQQNRIYSRFSKSALDQAFENFDDVIYQFEKAKREPAPYYGPG